MRFCTAFGIHVGDPSEATRVVVEFSRDKTALVEARAWHPTQQIEPTPDAGTRLSFTVANLERKLEVALGNRVRSERALDGNHTITAQALAVFERLRCGDRVATHAGG